MDRSAVDHWLQAYVEAWKSYDREQIGALFAEDVRYRYHPYDDPVEGREAVVESWLGEGDHAGASTRDEAGTYELATVPSRSTSTSPSPPAVAPTSRSPAARWRRSSTTVSSSASTAMPAAQSSRSGS